MLVRPEWDIDDEFSIDYEGLHIEQRKLLRLKPDGAL